MVALAARTGGTVPGSGGAAVATGVVLLVLNRARPVRAYSERPSAWLMLTPGQAGIGARLAF